MSERDKVQCNLLPKELEGLKTLKPGDKLIVEGDRIKLIKEEKKL